MPAFNRESFIENALKSLLKETHIELEIIVVDDGSSDNTCGIVKTLQTSHPHIKLINTSHGGVTKARNIGLKSVSKDARYVGFLDSDDLNVPHRLLRQSNILETSADIDFVIGLFKIFVKANEESCEVIPGSKTMTIRGIGVTNILFRKSVFDKIGLFDETLDSSEDADFVMRLMEAKVPYLLEDVPAILHRRHEHNKTNDTKKTRDSFIHALRKSIVRRREKNQTQSLGDLFKMPSLKK